MIKGGREQRERHSRPEPHCRNWTRRRKVIRVRAAGVNQLVWVGHRRVASQRERDRASPRYQAAGKSVAHPGSHLGDQPGNESTTRTAARGLVRR